MQLILIGSLLRNLPIKEDISHSVLGKIRFSNVNSAFIFGLKFEPSYNFSYSISKPKKLFSPPPLFF